jgi:uroporphyrinogen-III synthase
VVLTRPPQAAKALALKLRAAGAEVVAIPTVSIAPLPMRGGQESPAFPGDFTGVVFASQNAVRQFLRHRHYESALRRSSMALAAVGPQTAALLQARVGRAVLFPPEGSGIDALVAEMSRSWGPAQWRRLLHPVAAGEGAALCAGVQRLGGEVVLMPCYQTRPLPARRLLPRLAALARAPQPAALVFHSPSAVGAISAVISKDPELLIFFQSLAAVAVGATTAEALRQAGWRRVYPAPEASDQGIQCALMAVL